MEEAPSSRSFEPPGLVITLREGMKSMDHYKFQEHVRNLYSIVADLENMFPGRPFTPDGHMVGSLGECLVADAYGLRLMPPSNKGFDAITDGGEQVEIKATQSSRVAFRSRPEHTIIIRILKNGTFEECFNGPGDLIWRQFEGRPLPSNGQYQISVSKVKQLNDLVDMADRIPRLDHQGLFQPS